jgi:hypothetical protein
MRVIYEAYVGGDVEVDDALLEGLTKEEQDEIIDGYITSAANDDLDSHLTWEREEDA